MFTRGTEITGGGVVGGLIGQTFLVCFKSVASFVIVIALLFLGILLTAGLTPKKFFQYIGRKLKEARERRAIEAELEEDDDYADDDIDPVPPAIPDEPVVPEVPEKTPRKKPAPKFEPDVPIDDDFPEDNVPAPVEEETPEERRARLEREKYNDVMREAKKKKTPEEMDAENALFDDGDGEGEGDGFELLPPEEPVDGDLIGADLLDLLADSYPEDSDEDAGGEDEGGVRIHRESLSGGMDEAKQVPIDIPKPEYKFPPIELLHEGSNPVKAQNIREELHDNAAKLVSVLASFNVRTKIVGVSRGPTITRYELLPEPGTRVKSISNLVDDIALNLATSGVRIEAPIPGKAAVGIEVPNKTAESYVCTGLFYQ